jgi:ribosomal protein S18 acetylase RimI-like enzyme
MNSFKIRPVVDSDIDLICSFPQNVEELYFMYPKAEYPLTHSQLQDAIETRSDSMVLENDQNIIGFANFYQWETSGQCSIGNVIIAPSSRGFGAGKRLIHEMMKIAKSKHNANEIAISCFNKNTDGLIFYHKLGFKPYEIKPRFDKGNNPIVLIHMKKPI